MSCADYAIGLIDETEAGKRVRERITPLVGRMRRLARAIGRRPWRSGLGSP